MDDKKTRLVVLFRSINFSFFRRQVKKSSYKEKFKKHLIFLNRLLCNSSKIPSIIKKYVSKQLKINPRNTQEKYIIYKVYVEANSYYRYENCERWERLLVFR